ncbi:MAG: hypothetical protein LQ338_005983 [Usnochroma carphineum]|nr:MAG: hypothetical protein LQ338_005983 [Usnochroma carphineum]
MAESSQIEPNLSTYSTGFTASGFGPIPLTTIFTPPPSCLSTVTYDGTSLWLGGLLQTGDQNCYPPYFTDIFGSRYTPGICPHGWTSVANPNRVGPVTNNDGDLATRAFCCPSGYYHSSTDEGQLRHACASLFGSPLTNVYSTSTKAEGPIPLNPSIITVDPHSVDANTVYADIIQIQWAATDSNILRLMSQATSSSSLKAQSTSQATSSSSSKAQATSQATSSSSSKAQATSAQTAHQTIPSVAQTVSSSATPTSFSDADSLTAGSKAGIGISAAVGAVALALLAYFLWHQRTKQQQQERQQPQPEPEPEPQPQPQPQPQQQQQQQQQQQHSEDRLINGNMGGNGMKYYYAAHALPPEQEKDQLHGPAELPSEAAQELPADEGRSKLGSNAATRYSMLSGTTNTASSRNPSQMIEDTCV